MVCAAHDKSVALSMSCCSLPQMPPMTARFLQRDVEYLVTGSYDGTLAIWDVRATMGSSGLQPELIKRWPAHGTSTSASTNAAGSATTGPGSGEPVESAVGGRQGEQLASIVPDAASRPEVRCVCFVAERRLLCSGGNDCTIKVRSTCSSAAAACAVCKRLRRELHPCRIVCTTG
jgi:WD40 repeat protein